MVFIKICRSSKCDPDQDCQTWGSHLWTHLKFPTLTFPTLSKITITITITTLFSEDIIDVDIAVEDLIVRNISTFETKQVRQMGRGILYFKLWIIFEGVLV